MSAINPRRRRQRRARKALAAVKKDARWTGMPGKEVALPGPRGKRMVVSARAFERNLRALEQAAATGLA